MFVQKLPRFSGILKNFYHGKQKSPQTKKLRQNSLEKGVGRDSNYQPSPEMSERP